MSLKYYSPSASFESGKTGADATARSVQLPTAFIVASLLVLFIIPLLISWRMDALRQEIAQFASPARERVDDVELALAEEVSAARGYLLTEEEPFRATFLAYRAVADTAIAELYRLAGRLGPDVQQRLDDLVAAQARWAEPNITVLSGEASPEELIDLLPVQQERYLRAVEAAKALNRAIGRAEEARLNQIRSLDLIGIFATVLFVPLVFMATLLLIGISRRLRRQAAHQERRIRLEEALRNTAQALTKANDEQEVYQCILQHLASMAPDVRIRLDIVQAGMPDVQARPVDSALREEDATPITGERQEAGLAIPLLSETAPLGALVLEQDGGRPALEPDEVANLRILADLASLAIRRVRLMADERRARAQAESALRARDEVLAVVSHDLRSPLASLSLGVGMLADPVYTEKRARHVEMMKTTISRMNRLIQDLLDTVRLEAGQKLSLSMKYENISQVVEDTYAIFQVQAADRTQQLTCTVSDETPRVLMDRDRIEQVLSNLFSNALKFTPPGGSISVRVRPEGADVLVEVSDTGTGIAAEDLRRVFDPYWQVSRTARLGAGLGLPIAKGIVEAHGGRIWVESAPGAGTTFYFTLPVSPQEAT
jgi:signal transduction histidine kinase/CHASE3 domain sensor protein